MNWNSQCTYCGHVNRPDSEACERCDFPVGADDAHSHAGAPPYAYAAQGAQAFHVPSVRFEGAGDVIRPMLEVFRKHFQLVLILVAVATTAEVLMSYALARAVSPGAQFVDATRVVIASPAIFPAGWSGVAFGGLATLVSSALLTGSLVHGVLDLQTVGVTSAGSCLRRGLKSLPKVFLVTLIYTVVTMLGYAMFIVPGVIFSIIFAVAVPAAVAENAGAFESFNRSSGLTTDYRWRVFGTYFLWWIAVSVVSYVVGLSFTHGGQRGTLAAVAAQALVNGVLNSTTAVLSVFVFLGLLNEKGQVLDARLLARGRGALAPNARPTL